jgi:hypothetical protein
MRTVRQQLSLLLSCLIASCLLAACGSRGQSETSSDGEQEDAQAKAMLQGVWVEDETDAISFWAKGDSIFYADSVSQPTRFAIIGDQLILYSTDVRYHIERQTENLFWFKNQNGDIVKLEKSMEPLPNEFSKGEHQRILTYTEVVKQDSVVMYDGNRYHWYIAINPTKYKVHTLAYNSDGVEVDNIYYDNIMHVSVFKGAHKFFSRDFRKQDYVQKVPEQFLQQSVLSNMEYSGVDADGFHFVATICIPEGATCYKAENIISFDGQLTTRLIEY